MPRARGSRGWMNSKFMPLSAARAASKESQRKNS